MVKTRSLSHLGLVRHRVVTDRRTDRIAIANTRSQQYLPVQLWRVKICVCYMSQQRTDRQGGVYAMRVFTCVVGGAFRCMCVHVHMFMSIVVITE